MKAQFEELNTDCFRNSMGPVEECLCDSGIDKRNVHVGALIAGSARIHMVQKMIQELFTFVAHGNRVVDELRKQDCVTEMWKNISPFRLTEKIASF